MKRSIATAIVGLSSILPAIWFHVNPEAAKYCPKVNGEIVEYSTDRQNRLGETVTLTFGGLAQTGLCKQVENFPA